MRPFVIALLVLDVMLVFQSATVAQGKKELAAKGWGTLKGKVTFPGPKPKLDDLKAKMEKHQDGKGCCLKGPEKELTDPTWIIDPMTSGLANVVVYLKAPANYYFPISKADRIRKDEVVVDQPHCAFLPHVVGLFPEYFDGEKYQKTGQTFTIKNSANVLHNARLVSLNDQGFSIAIAANGKRSFHILPEKLPLGLRCDLHPWMTGYLAIFDHPYFAITKEDGAFHIPRVPPGAAVTVMAWHEGVGYVLGAKGTMMTFEQGAVTTMDFTVKLKAPAPAK